MDGKDGGAEYEGIVSEAEDVARGSGDTEEGGGALVLKGDGDLLGEHLELHLEIEHVLVQRVLRVAALAGGVDPFLRIGFLV